MQDYLEHFGILGQKWGQKNGPPYPLGSNISTGRRLKEAFAKRKAAKEERAKAKANKKKSEKMLKAKKAKAAKELKEKKKQEKREKYIKEMMKDPAKLYKYRDQFTTEEINKMLTRYEAEKRLYDYSKSSLNKGKEYIDLIVGYANSIYNAYNVYNKFTGNKGENSNQNNNQNKLQNNQIKNNSNKKDKNDYILDNNKHKKADKNLQKARERKAYVDKLWETERLNDEYSKSLYSLAKKQAAEEYQIKKMREEENKRRDEEERKRYHWKV